MGWFSLLVRHPARKRSGSILTTPEPARGPAMVKLPIKNSRIRIAIRVSTKIYAVVASYTSHPSVWLLSTFRHTVSRRQQLPPGVFDPLTSAD